VGSCRRELLDSIIALNERHLYRLIRLHHGLAAKLRLKPPSGSPTPVKAW
jgi:hypothetical protein